MRIVIQRVQSASVTINNSFFSAIEKGLMILVGIEESDNAEDIDWLCKKIIDLRIFADDAGKMNLSVKETNGDILVISQFTLHASTKKGNRPSYLKAAKPEVAIPLYENFIAALSNLFQKPVKTGVFGADMQVSLINDGPVTICIDSKNKK
jgi:D-aminoacyl-tRNA deacylase